jgi:hypothetical protein
MMIMRPPQQGHGHGSTRCSVAVVSDGRAGGEVYRFPLACFYVKQKIMSLSISAKQKKRSRGRPRTGVTPMIGLRLSEQEIARLDRWAAQNGFSRSKAIRELIERGLKR